MDVGVLPTISKLSGGIVHVTNGVNLKFLALTLKRHKCKARQFLLLLPDEVLLLENLPDDEAQCEQMLEDIAPPSRPRSLLFETETQVQHFQLSSGALSDIPSPCTLRITASILGLIVTFAPILPFTVGSAMVLLFFVRGYVQRLLHTDSLASFHAIAMLPCDPPTPQPNLAIPSHYPGDLATLLRQFSAVFATPHSLPLPRPHDHSIHLLPNSPPVNVRSYRYPHCQKEAMATLINDMLRDDLIHPSTSPYSSPVILVKKKDGTWGFRMDYRVLNAITVRDYFSIPTINELLDELRVRAITPKNRFAFGLPPNSHVTWRYSQNRFPDDGRALQISRDVFWAH
ncbi:UNVERIFIED_CONTAM: hypothetical protein Slati_4502500 [Sesamum latifolium]|uniref:Uncharacterized protein n=1 Tax=Sesamum latifolium TaxID=2727402 RepID=A0AAW2SSH7_9LAMI